MLSGLIWKTLARKNLKKQSRLVFLLKALFLLKTIFCLYFSPIVKLWRRKKVIFKVFVFWKYSKNLTAFKKWWARGRINNLMAAGVVLKSVYQKQYWYLHLHPQQSFSIRYDTMWISQDKFQCLLWIDTIWISQDKLQYLVWILRLFLSLSQWRIQGCFNIQDGALYNNS